MSDVKTRILLRSDIASKWLQVNPTLLKGEIGIEYDPGLSEGRKIKFKIGDGFTEWKDLEYVADYDSAISAINTKIGTESVASQIETAIEGLSSVYQEKLPEGAESGKYLTADAEGNLTWKAVADPTWANITGNIADNEALSNALNAKQNAITEENKLSADLIDIPESGDKQFVSAEEKADIAKISGLETAVGTPAEEGKEASGLYKGVADAQSAAEAADGKADAAQTAAGEAKTAAEAAQADVDVLEGIVGTKGEGETPSTGLFAELDKKIDREDGKSLISTEELTKLAGIEAGAEVNVIETIKVNDEALTVTDKTVNIDLSGYTTDGEYNELAGRVTTLETAATGYATKDDISGLETEIGKKANSADVYTKDDVYTKEETAAEIAKIKQFELVSMAELPTASETTMNKIYLIPAADKTERNIRDEFITIKTEPTEEGGEATYSWEKIGDTKVSLAGYATEAYVNTAVDKKQDTLKAGTNVEITEDNTINVTVDEAEVNEDTFKFERDLETMYDLGKYKGTLKDPVTIPVAGKTFAEAWDIIFKKEENPKTTQPTLTINSSSLGEKEVGTEVTVSYTTTFSAGSYSYDAATGVTADDYKISFNGETLTTASGSFTKLTVGDSTSLSITGTFDHTDGIVPHTNIGNEYATGQIKAKDDKAATPKGTLTGYRKMFYGTLESKPEEMTSVTIRTLTGEKSAAKVIDVNIPLEALRVVIAVPSDKSVSSITDENGLGAQIFSSFAQTTVDVEGANGYEAKTYNVYYLDYAKPNDKANVYHVTVA